MIITPRFSHFCVVFSNQKFNNCSSTMDVGFVKILSDCFCGHRLFKMNIEFCCHLWCSSYFSLSCGFRQLFPLADGHPMICVRRHTPNKVAVLVTNAPAKRAPTICPLWKPDTSLVYEMLQNTLCKGNDTGTTQYKQTKEQRKVN
jgi:hypothetical protein